MMKVTYQSTGYLLFGLRMPLDGKNFVANRPILFKAVQVHD